MRDVDVVHYCSCPLASAVADYPVTDYWVDGTAAAAAAVVVTAAYHVDAIDSLAGLMKELHHHVA